jgi:hypothetical protein
MAKFYVYRTNLCEVTEIVEVEAATADDANHAVCVEGEGEFIGLTVGDISSMSNETIETLPAEPHNIPSCFYPASAQQ